MSLIVIFSLLVVHWLADFVAQTHWQAMNKSSDNWALTKHIGSYTMIWYIFVMVHFFIMGPSQPFGVIWFLLITFGAHWITDYITSREVKKLREKEDYHNMFVVIGFDQLLHYAQIFLCYKYFIQ